LLIPIAKNAQKRAAKIPLAQNYVQICQINDLSTPPIALRSCYSLRRQYELVARAALRVRMRAARAHAKYFTDGI